VRPDRARSARRGFAGALGLSLLLHALTLILPLPGGTALAPRAASTLPALAEVTLLPPLSSGGAPAARRSPSALERGQPRRPTQAPSEPDAALADSATPPGLPFAVEAAAFAPLQPAPPAAAPADHLSHPPAELQQAATPSADSPPAASVPPADDPTASLGTPPVQADNPPEIAADAAPAPGSIRFPRSGRLEYSLSIGNPPTPVGRAIYEWTASDTAYRLGLSAETTGLVGLLRRVRVVQTSVGRITPDGLQPDAFSMDRGDPAARNTFARFDWTGGQVTFGYPDAIQTAVLRAGTQDTLSLILQFAFVPIGDGQREVLLTSGRKLYAQTYERVGEDLIETPAGAWRTWHLRRVRAQAGDEGYDMWLASDRPFLPVRLRWTDRRGRVTSATLDTVHLARD